MFTKPTDTVSFDRMNLAIVRGDVKAAVVALEIRTADACTAKKFTPVTCLQIQSLVEKARALDDKLVAALLDPKVEVDWAEVVKVLKLIIDIAMKFA
jgi:hypothetical protein